MLNNISSIFYINKPGGICSVPLCIVGQFKEQYIKNCIILYWQCTYRALINQWWTAGILPPIMSATYHDSVVNRIFTQWGTPTWSVCNSDLNTISSHKEIVGNCHICHSGYSHYFGWSSYPQDGGPFPSLLWVLLTAIRMSPTNGWLLNLYHPVAARFLKDLIKSFHQ